MGFNLKLYLHRLMQGKSLSKIWKRIYYFKMIRSSLELPIELTGNLSLCQGFRARQLPKERELSFFNFSKVWLFRSSPYHPNIFYLLE